MKSGYVYALVDAEDNLLYIGSTVDYRRRIKQHIGGWPPKAVHYQIEPKSSFVAYCGSIEVAKLVEALLIKAFRPPWNANFSHFCDGKEELAYDYLKKLTFTKLEEV